ncbi:bifunctional DNA primase/polymerase [Nocardioides alcanivorans]|uniref:bifunctional DNA primase/polymerase n=1 Tax=Nocardioides alcanivorans TaxID=2897352 RepID=UPI001F44E928|nr:bifunctional DNA primase/polymerase [Nocardioides alcanivorans]
MTDSTRHVPSSPRWSPALVADLEQAATPASAAAVLASAGVPVFPCVPFQKNPLTEHGFHDATTKESVVAEWWRQWPDANVAMPTGFASGVDVVDIDVHASGSGFDALQPARSAGLLGTPAWVVSTPSGGMHACFLRAGAVEQRSWQVPGRHVDFRGDGGYVVLPPSTVVQPDGEVHPYRVVNVATRQPDAVDANALRRFLEPARSARAPADLPNIGARPDRLASWVATRGEGERNRGLFWASCRMAESGERFDIAATVLGEAAQSAGLTEREAMTTIRSAYRIANRLGPPSVAGERLGPSRAAEEVRL